MLAVLWPTATRAEIEAAIPGHSWGKLHRRVFRLRQEGVPIGERMGGAKSCARPAEEHERLLAMWGTATQAELEAAFPGVKQNTLAQRVVKLRRRGLAVPARTHVAADRTDLWAKEDNRRLAKLWPTMTREALATAFPGRTFSALKARVRDLRREGVKVEPRTVGRAYSGPIEENLSRSLQGNALYAAASAAVGRFVPPDVRDDVIGDMIADHLDGELALADFPTQAARYLRRVVRAGELRNVSLDAIVPGTDDLRRIDMLADDDWQDAFDAADARLDYREHA